MDQERSLTAVIGDLVDEGRALFRSELRLARAVEDETVAEPRGHGVKRLGAIAPVEIIRERRTAPLDALALHVAPELDEPLGIRIWQRPQ